MNKQVKKNPLDANLQKIIDATHHDPFSVLGRHQKNKQIWVTVFLPNAESVQIPNKGMTLTRIPDTDFFEGILEATRSTQHYQLEGIDKQGHPFKFYDPYDFPPQLPSFDQHLFGEGKHWHIYQKLGAHLHTVDDVKGVHFSVWAPNAQRVSVVGDFNRWDGRCHPMRNLGGSGIWEIFIPGLTVGCLYKFEILTAIAQELLVKTDPYGQQFEFRPQTAAVVVSGKQL
jgi:1,4-alpha-glucan branching enzyme